MKNNFETSNNEQIIIRTIISEFIKDENLELDKEWKQKFNYLYILGNEELSLEDINKMISIVKKLDEENSTLIQYLEGIKCAKEIALQKEEVKSDFEKIQARRKSDGAIFM